MDGGNSKSSGLFVTGADIALSRQLSAFVMNFLPIMGRCLLIKVCSGLGVSQIDLGVLHIGLSESHGLEVSDGLGESNSDL